ncbi:IclR family transcriptional regulator [Rhodococcus sp. ARC_M6]|uniref:IclR family transcriptional regulator n=1 Tax=Rhodococcus sp. ARC_M6 TaxID=2928852 RepID=UPI001FB2E6DE|nr:helix-turn-helix domain-containing protein [Rhodococcus sp. ARC_M6]MCJ0906283.1 helix-turn-helix domain-containing protein [Rhodococcus sp. ARC_M6]
MTSESNGSSVKQPGSQTLARGLQALELVATTPDGMTIQEVAEALGVHRTIASRLLTTVADFRLIKRSTDGKYRAAGGLAALARDLYAGLRDEATPLLRRLANSLGASVALFVAERTEAVAVAVVEPKNARYWVSFREGGRHPIDRGAAGYALLAGQPPLPGESSRVTDARRDGYVLSYGEVEPGYWGLGVPLKQPANEPAGCLTLITASEELARAAIPEMIAAADKLSGGSK